MAPENSATPPIPLPEPVAAPGVRILRGADALASLSLLEESGLFGAFEFDLVARSLACSAEMFRRHGLVPEDPTVRFEDVWERILPGDRDRFQRAAIEGVTTGQLSCVYRVQPPGGPLRWMQVWARLQRAADGSPLKWTGLVLDASPSVVAETLQQESRDQVIELVESIAESFIALDREFCFTYVNQRVCDKTCKTREQLIGRSLWELFPEAAASEFYVGYKRVLTERTRQSFLVPYNQPDGSHSWFDVHAFPTAEGMAALIRDVTELTTAREALEASEERFRRAQQAANIGAFEWNLVNNQLTWAAKVPTFTEVAEADDFSEYLRFVDEADRPRILAAIERVMAGGQHAIEMRVHPPDGRILWFYFRAEAVFDTAGKPIRVYGIAMDVTDRKLAEEALRKSEKLAAAGKLAATIAHEINNPLEAVTNLLYLSVGMTEPDSSLHLWLTQAEEELARVAAIVRQTLGFYRGTTAPAAVDLPTLLEESLAVFRNRIAAQGIEVFEACSEPISVLAIEGEIRQIVTNLLANAIDAVADGGAIWIDLRQRDGSVRLEIRDNGGGIAPDVMDRLFEPFFTTRKASGTGLGLWVSRELAQKNGGSIETSSPGLGHGATFVLTLPQAPANP
jgi:PAS domain S-box-containing protein